MPKSNRSKDKKVVTTPAKPWEKKWVTIEETSMKVLRWVPKTVIKPDNAEN